MNPPRFPLAVYLLLFVGFSSSLAGQNLPSVPKAQLGLQLSLTTGTYRFSLPWENPVARTRFPVPERRTFPASAVLQNLTRDEVSLRYPNAVAAAEGFKFSVVSSTGEVIWESSTASEEAPVTLTIAGRGVLRKTIQVPLTAADGSWLPVGKYTVRAVAGSGEAVASVPLVIVDPETETGIRGQVLQRNTRTPAAGNSKDKIALDKLGTPTLAVVTIREIRDPRVEYDHPPFTYGNVTDDEGRFEATMPPGKFEVAAVLMDGQQPENQLNRASRIYTVRVERGQFSAQDLVLDRAEAPPQLQLVASVYAVSALFKGTALGVSATAQVGTPGWSGAKLVRRADSTDTILELDFLALPARGIQAQVISSIGAGTVIKNGTKITTVRVHAVFNTIEVPAGTSLFPSIVNPQ